MNVGRFLPAHKENAAFPFPRQGRIPAHAIRIKGAAGRFAFWNKGAIAAHAEQAMRPKDFEPDPLAHAIGIQRTWTAGALIALTSLNRFGMELPQPKALDTERMGCLLWGQFQNTNSRANRFRLFCGARGRNGQVHALQSLVINPCLLMH